MSASELVNIIRNEAIKAFGTEYSGFETGTVVSSPPHLAIRIDNMKLVLGAGDLIVCESLTRYKRIVTLKGIPQTDFSLGDGTAENRGSISLGPEGTSSASFSEGGQTHSLDGYQLKNPKIELNYAELTFENLLKPGERVVLQALPGGQKFVVIDRVVEYE